LYCSIFGSCSPELYTPARTLRSSDTNLLSVPRVRTCFGSRSFSVAAPTVWNFLPFDIRNSCSIASFRRKLKTFYFSTSSHVYSLVPPHSSPQRLRFGEFLVDIVRCINQIYLLTYLLTLKRRLRYKSAEILVFRLVNLHFYIKNVYTRFKRLKADIPTLSAAWYVTVEQAR